MTEISQEAVKRVIELLSDSQKLEDALPPEEREMYERCQQSIVDARRYANQIEGQIWIV